MDIMPSLMEEQRVRIEKNMGLVGRVIRDCVHALDMGCIYTYDDLFQIGCVGLCKAAQTYQPEYKSAFSTYEGAASGDGPGHGENFGGRISVRKYGCFNTEKPAPGNAAWPQ